MSSPKESDGPSSSKSKPRRPVQLQVDVLTALESDIKMVINTFLESKDSSFESFYEIWKRVDISLVYGMGFTSLPTVKFVERAYQTLFELFETATELALQSAIIFAIYSMYFSQPCDPHQVPMPIAIEERLFNKLTSLYHQTEWSSNKDTAYALYRLFKSNAFQLFLRPTTTSVRADEHSELGTGELIELMPSKMLRQQIRKIDEAMRTDPLLNNDYADVTQIAAEYDGLMEEMSKMAPDAVASLSKRNFPQDLDHVSVKYSDTNSSLVKRPRLRSASVRSETVPRRPLTAPPQFTNMPDLSFFDIPNSSQEHS